MSHFIGVYTKSSFHTLEDTAPDRIKELYDFKITSESYETIVRGFPSTYNILD
jgi:hypothetical protein